jgi:hypothetical protein
MFVSGDSPISGNPYFFFSKTNSPSCPEKEVSVENIMQIQLDKMLSWSRLVSLTKDVPNFKPEPKN